jgi:hypothetical protein
MGEVERASLWLAPTLLDVRTDMPGYNVGAAHIVCPRTAIGYELVELLAMRQQLSDALFQSVLVACQHRPLRKMRPASVGDGFRSSAQPHNMDQTL